MDSVYSSFEAILSEVPQFVQHIYVWHFSDIKSHIYFTGDEDENTPFVVKDDSCGKSSRENRRKLCKLVFE